MVVHLVVALQEVLLLIITPFVRHVEGTSMFCVVHSGSLEVWAIDTGVTNNSVNVILLLVLLGHCNLKVLFFDYLAHLLS